MPWAKLDDGFTDHPKVMAAGPMASWLFVCGVTYSARMLTDGFIPVTQVRKLADLDNAIALAERLVEVGLWERCRDGFRIHDYLEYQPSAEKVRADRKAAQERMQRVRSGEVRPNNERSSEEVRLPRPTPVVPVEIPAVDVSKPTVSHPPERGAYTQEFEETFWKPYPPTNGSKADAFKAWKQMSGDDRASAIAALPAWLACDRWREGYVKHAASWLRGRMWEVAPAAARASPNGRQPQERRPHPKPVDFDALRRAH
jgi:hypothetical protein